MVEARTECGAGTVDATRSGDRDAANPSRRTADSIDSTLVGMVIDDASTAGTEVVARIETASDALCRSYERMPTSEIVTEADRQLTPIGSLLVLARAAQGCDEAVGRRNGAGNDELRRLVVASGWFAAVAASARFDAGQTGSAEKYWDRLRDAARQARHPELAGWAWQLSAHFALAERRCEPARLAARAGQVLTADTPAAAHRALVEAQACARLGDREDALRALERAGKVVDGLAGDDWDHRFAIDQTRLIACSATVYLWLGEDAAAEDYAWQALVRTVSPEGATDYPMRVAELRLVLGTVAARRGDLEQALHHGRAALAGQRVCAPAVLADALDLHAALVAAGCGRDHATGRFADAMTGLASRYGLAGP